MKKKYLSLLICALLFSSSAYASVGSQEDGNAESIDTDLNWSTNLDHSASGSVGTVSVSASPTFTGDVTFRSTLIANGRVNGVSSFASSTTAILPSSLPFTIIRKYVSGASGLDVTPGSTLTNGTPGQVLVLQVVGLMAGGSWTVTPVTATGFTSLTLDTRGDSMTLLYLNDTLGWIVTANGGGTINQASGV